MNEPWFERTFAFGLPIERLPMLLERLRGTPLRLRAKTRGLPEADRTRREGGAWSIQENVGHLLDLELLWHGRVEDFAAGAPALRPADLQNSTTWQADHNSRPLEELLSLFEEARLRLVEALEALDPSVLARTSVHPRLKQPIHVVDHAFFVCEHDDHHLARIHELIRR